MTVDGPVLLIDRLANVMTGVSSVSVLLAVLGSLSLPNAEALLVRVVPLATELATWTVTVMTTDGLPAAMSNAVQLKPETVAAHVAPEADTKLVPAGRVSLTTMPEASDGPPLETVSV